MVSTQHPLQRPSSSRIDRSQAKARHVHSRCHSTDASSTVPSRGLDAARTKEHSRRVSNSVPITTLSNTTTTTTTTSDQDHASDTGLHRVFINDLRSQEIVVEFPNDDVAIRYPSFWLRDHCPCAGCTHPDTQQRQIDTFSLDLDTRADSAEATADGLHVMWHSSAIAEGEKNHKSTYPWSWLREHEPFAAKSRTVHQRSDWQAVWPSPSRSPATTAVDGLPTVEFEAVMTTDRGLWQLLNQIRTYGLAFISGTPPTPSATEDLLNRIAFIRVTHYGAFWDFTSEPNPIDTAYTNLALPAHTDNTYFTDPCGLQLFHVLQPATGTGSGEGSANNQGESTFVDGFGAATTLHQLNPQFYQILSQIPIVSHASGDQDRVGSILNNSVNPAGYPVFTHATPFQPALHRPSNLTQIRWNNTDRHSSTVWPSHQSMQLWYAAAKAWTQVLKSPQHELVVKLEPGTPVIFDNWRVLHGRKGFLGERRVCGGYIGMDDFLAKARLMGKLVGIEDGEL